MATAIVSVMAGIPARRDVAMTGEITLRGRVWPIAGLKEKLLAALRGGISSSPLRVRLPVIMSYSQNQWLHVLDRLFSSSIDPSQRRDDQDDVRSTVLQP
jgi:predicted S18 family serine protease